MEPLLLQMPDEVLLQIFIHLNLDSYFQLASTNSKCHQLSLDPILRSRWMKYNAKLGDPMSIKAATAFKIPLSQDFFWKYLEIRASIPKITSGPKWRNAHDMRAVIAWNEVIPLFLRNQLLCLPLNTDSCWKSLYSFFHSNQPDDHVFESRQAAWLQSHFKPSPQQWHANVFEGIAEKRGWISLDDDEWTMKRFRKIQAITAQISPSSFIKYYPDLSDLSTS